MSTHYAFAASQTRLHNLDSLVLNTIAVLRRTLHYKVDRLKIRKLTELKYVNKRASQLKAIDTITKANHSDRDAERLTVEKKNTSPAETQRRRASHRNYFQYW